MCERKTPAELVALYSLEPEIKDVYVEGVIDRELLNWFFAYHGIDDIHVYMIDDVDVSEDLIREFGLNTGSNRSRLLALSVKLAEFLESHTRVVCVVDRDNEDYLPTAITNSFLEFTDHNSMELYLFSAPIIQKVISLVLGGFSLSASDIIRETIPVLEELYLIRLTNEALGWAMKWIDFKKYVKVGRSLDFSKDEFTKAYLLKNRKWSQRSAFARRLETFRQALLHDPRRRVRGHDLMDLLFHVVSKLKPKRRFGDAATFQGAVTGCIEAQDLAHEGLFSRLLVL